MAVPSVNLADMEQARIEPGSRESAFNEPKVGDHGAASASSPSKFGAKIARHIQKFEKQLVVYNLEVRGIQRVGLDERLDLTWKNYAQAFLLWFSINLAANNVTLGMLGPAVYGLSFTDASLCAVFGSVVGSLPVAYIATWGPVSGNRTMIFARYTMGWWPSKLVVLLNLIVLLGYALIDCVIAGQILSAVSPNGSLSVVVGIIIVALIAWAITTFGIQLFHSYERYAFLPQIVVWSILLGVSASNYDLSSPSMGDARTIIGNRLSFFSICLSAAITYSGIAADYFAYYPPRTSRWALSTLILLGLSTSFAFAFIPGIGLASGIGTNTAYSTAYSISQGALIVEGFSSLHGFGKFCGVVVALGLIANIVPPTYSSGIDFQILGRYAAKVPRFVWNTIGVVIYTVCALAGRDSLSVIFQNFLALMGYWVAIWIAITLDEQLIFRRRRGYDWAAWDDRSKLPIGIAAFIAFLVGWGGAILCMAQVWYIGPIAKDVGQYGADMGNYVGFSWAALVYPPLRYLELRKVGR
ncbi:nucleoside [Lasallia pustulata]|uniref:Nucleoside n=1 Tax=Lasallia pustulata TaxID=136370 RepID=A0A1W5CWX4_9LECA|nr:nucleoside [Lasallia pustulata]